MADYNAPAWFDPEVERQRELSKLLRKQAMQQQQGKMVSGHYISPGIGAAIVPIAQTYASKQAAERADEMEMRRRGELSEALRTPKPIPDGIRDPNYQPPGLTDRLAALQNNPQAQQLAMQLRLQEAARQAEPQYRTISPDQARQMGLGDGVWQMSPQGQISRAYAPEAPDYNKPVIMGPNGPMPNPAYVQAQSQIRAAGRNQTNIDFGGMMGGSPELGKLATDYGYILDPNTRQPVIDPATGLPTAAPVPGSKEYRTIKSTEEKAKQAKGLKDRYGDVVTDTIDRTLDQVTKANLPVTGLGSYLSGIPGTPARDVKANLDTIRANIGFDRLQQMRDASPTGGALGQVSEFENRLLQSTLGNLEQSQSEEQFINNLKRVKEIYDRVVNEGISDDEAAKLMQGGATKSTSLGLTEEEMQELEQLRRELGQ